MKAIDLNNDWVIGEIFTVGCGGINSDRVNDYRKNKNLSKAKKI